MALIYHSGSLLRMFHAMLLNSMKNNLHRNVFSLLKKFQIIGFVLFSVGFWGSAYGQQTFTSKQSGNWSNKNTWVQNEVPGPGDNAIISSGHTVTFVAANTINNLTISEGGILTDNGHANTITGNFMVHGTYSGSGSINLTGNGTQVGGSGTISNTASINVTGNKAILVNANLTKGSGNLNILEGSTITNNGTITLGGSIISITTPGTWTNEENSTLNIGGTLLTVAPGGTLDAFAVGNTINYFGAGAYTFKLPEPNPQTNLSTYYNLIISGSGTKTLPNGEVVIEGDLTINSTLSGSGLSKTLYVRGNWINNGGFTPGSGTVIFDGIHDQTIINNTAIEDFHHLIVNKSSGSLILKADVVVASNLASQANRSTLTMQAGNIDVGSKSLTLGKLAGGLIYTGILSWSSGKINGPFKRWINHEWSDSRRYFTNEIVFYNGTWWRRISDANNMSVPEEGTNWTAYNDGIIFPIGTPGHDRTATIRLNDLTTGSLTVNFNSSYPGNTLTETPLVDGAVTIYNVFRDGFWAFKSENSLSSSDFNVELTGDGFTGFPINDNTRIVTRTSSGGPWSLSGTHGGRDGTTVTRNTITNLNAEFAFGSDDDCQAPGSTVTISGDQVVCKGATQIVYSLVDSENNPYAPEGSSWTVVGGTFFPSGETTESGSSSVIVNWGQDGMLGSLSVVETNACTQGPAITKSVDIHALPASITGKLNVPENSEIPVTYSIEQQPGYTYSWEVTGGTIASANGTNIVVNWGAAGTGEVCVAGNFAGCETSSTVHCIPITIYRVISSVKSGSWSLTNNASNRSLWDCDCIPTSSDNITIKNLHTVTISANTGVTVNHLTIAAGGTLSTGTNAQRTLTVNGDLNLFGTLGGASEAPGAIVLGAGSGNNPEIIGTGTITNVAALNINSSRTILPETALTKPKGTVNIGPEVMVFNNGTISFGGDVIGADSESAWINSPNAIMEVGGALLATGRLDASATDNLVRYNGLTEQTIKIPDHSGQYHTLEFSGTGLKVLPPGTISIKGGFSNDAEMSAGNSTVDFNGSSTITGSIAPNFNNLRISGELTPSNIDGQINVAGNFTNNGTFSHNSGTVNFNGTSGEQQIAGTSATTFRNITASNSVSVEAATVDLEGILHVAAGKYFDADGANNNRVFRLRSTNDTPADDASIGPLLNGAEVRGKVTVERYMDPKGKQIYRYISSPVAGATVADWQDNFIITGNFNDRDPLIPASVCNVNVLVNNPSLFYYEETEPGIFDNGFLPYPAPGTNASDSELEMGRGYAAFIRDCTEETVIDVRNEIHQGPKNFPVSHTPNGEVEGDAGWNLVGNPYPSAIRWDLGANGGWQRSNNISNVVAILDNHWGAFRYWDGTQNLDPNVYFTIENGVIASGQAFWVYAAPGATQLTITENAKYTGELQHGFYRAKGPESVPTFSVSMKKENSQWVDEAFVKIRKGTRPELDQWDAPKLSHSILFPADYKGDKMFDLATVTEKGNKMAISAIPSVREGQLIPLHIANVSEGSYQIAFNASGEFAQYFIEVTDKAEGITKTLALDETYTFSVSNAQKHDVNRITLRLVGSQSLEEKNYSFAVYPNPVKDKVTLEFSSDMSVQSVTVLDLRGVKLEHHPVNATEKSVEINFSSKPNGLYLMRIEGLGYNRVVKIIKD